MIGTSRTSFSLLVVSAAGILGGCTWRAQPGYYSHGGAYYAEPQVMVDVSLPPPPVRVEIQTVAPSPGYIWVSGYWHWSNTSWMWTSGRWERSRVGYVWSPPRYEPYQGRYRYASPRWTRRAHKEQNGHGNSNRGRGRR